jgi:hypothetical protein
MKPLIIALSCVLVSSGVYAADSSLTAAKDLYASAAYEDALSVLTGLASSTDVSPDVTQQIEQYRAFCLYALGRRSEAESVAEALIRRDPMFQPAADELSPRIETMFTDVQKKVLPVLIREKYRMAKAAVERKEFGAAEPQLVGVAQMAERAHTLGLTDESLSDIAVLAEGFLQLTRAASQPQQAVRMTEIGSESPAVAMKANNAAVNAAVASPQVFVQGSPGVTAPVPIRQTLPSIPVRGVDARIGEPCVRSDGRRRGQAVEVQAGHEGRRSGPLRQVRRRGGSERGSALI